MTTKQAPQQQQITINTADEMSRGHFSNSMFVSHSPEEFIIDWLLNSPNGTHLVSRIIVTPGHIKRIIAALLDNMKKYEQNFGQVTTIEPSQQTFH
ncbi:MAG: DUF3467 domain-containing protein [Nitrospinota bacterium]|jgi:hypothetical protein|nr:MAG: hypothetical protein A2W53_00275 [Nitrospinae bacterium RIFCSPHIGHO2_02_39_11]OGV97889.1 MAG: hypothetical protein A3D97_09175 [Nitrospinae bacterium RIFCSPHIGHO2_12_FULL_39_42]OGW02509.1 MAG: hypothetical protein A3D20_06830 [Nitrospinae bacterium RIFCSPHIGHO2_02_FULL_39_82]OGW06517.1 MAG: hypothetical protein A2Z59_08165 [Nitrospinae bacterium RIFCSPLOWO2_02_39_17]OGW06937.1 MAG: hypothetical protein A3I04_01985 [Nitrospinae bacterium RIFCSPLOWO2_02_FULL_39_110]OGW08791.1 MAG: hypoth